jgi:hypothetical protein
MREIKRDVQNIHLESSILKLALITGLLEGIENIKPQYVFFIPMYPLITNKMILQPIELLKGLISNTVSMTLY